MVWLILGIVMLLALLAVIGVSVVMFRATMMRPKQPMTYDGGGAVEWEETKRQIEEGKAWFMAQSPRRVYIQSFDGLKLAAWYLPHPQAVRSVICVHGYLSCGLQDYGAAIRYYYETGSNVLVIDQRSHGDSEGKYIGFGVQERWDLLRWIEWVNGACGADFPLYLSGISMGSATVMMTLGLELPGNVRGAVADCGYSSLWEEFTHVMKTRYHLPPFPILYCAEFIARLVTKIDFRSVTAVQALEKAKVPVLFIHGGADSFVPAWMTTERNYPACRSQKKLIIVDRAEHGMSYSVERERCRQGLEWLLSRGMCNMK